ncbi:MAG: phenylacetate--CoA ligase family protein [Actinobacteria bacterium]|nr:MAG: phenylacetate--CoA ligase family protein [Actinomycetota bacterium]
MTIWNPEYETMERGALAELQLRRLQTTVAWVYERVPYYRDKLDELGVKPRHIKRPEDVRLLPFTAKTALRDTYPFGMFAVPMEQVNRLHSSSGTTGRPIVVGYTRGDLNTWSECTARLASAAGVTAKDRVQVAFGYTMFTGGFGMHYGVEKIGATVIPAGAGNTERHLLFMQTFGTTALISTPSYALYLAEVGEKMGMDFSDLPLRVGLFGGEPSGEHMREEIQKRLHILATDNYGLTETMGPGLSGECDRQNGLHINEDHFLCELVDPNTGEPVEEGEGELIVTTLTKEAIPMLRYRTRDLTSIDFEPCSCGRTTARMKKVRQRTDDMLIIRGVNVFPSQIEDVLLQIEHVQPHYVIVVDRKRSLDDLEVKIEVSEELFSDSMRDMVAFTKQVADRLHSVIGLHAKITLVEPGSIERTAGKAKHVIDKRDLD